MVFVTLGTQKQQFTRILKDVENSNLLKDEEIIVQRGHTKYESKRLKLIDFISIDEMKEYIEKSEFVITHGGVGSIIDALNLGKKVLAVPRLKKYVEHVDDHQKEICKKLCEEGYIEQFLEEDSIDEKIKKLRNSKYKKYENDKKYLDIIEKDIEDFLK